MLVHPIRSAPPVSEPVSGLALLWQVSADQSSSWKSAKIVLDQLDVTISSHRTARNRVVTLGMEKGIIGMIKIGYIVPEFPGQTHTFFWREVRRLEQMGAAVQIVSTRRPPPGIRSHTWSDDAEKRTIYLQERSVVVTAANTIGALLSGFPKGWLPTLASIMRSKVTFKQRVALFAMAVFAAKLARIAKKNQWNHIHVHSCANAANIAAFASKMSGIPYSLTLHGSLSDYGENQLEKWEKAKFGIAVTKRLRAQIGLALGSSIADKTVIAPMGVNLDEFTRDHAYQPWLQTGAARLYSVGRLNPGKGHNILIKAISIIKKRGYNVHLTIAGQDEQGGTGYKIALINLIEKLDLQENVTLIGAVSEDVVRTGLLDSHIFVLASLHEALGVAIMEAMALELPVIATSVGGIPDLIDHDMHGLLVSPGNAIELADAILIILNNPELAASFSSENRRKIELHYNDRISAEILIKNASN